MRRSVFGALLFMMASMVAFGQAATPTDAGQDHKDLQELNRNAVQDKQDARSDVNDLRQDKTNMRTAVHDGDKAAASKDSKDIHQDQRALNQDKRDITRDKQRARQIRANSPAMGPRGGHR
jgi:hypothetical protein